MKKMSGIIAVTVTPFAADGAVDWAAAEQHIEKLIAAGVHGLLPIGATGEFASLSMDERKTYAEFVLKRVNGRVPVMVGAVSMNIDDTLEIARHAATAGADALMILPAPGLHLSQEEIYQFYRHISAKVTLPVMVYNNPGSAGVDIAPETLERIATLPHMEYLKESTGSIQRLTRSVDEVGKDLVVLCGCETLAYESFVMGAQGWIAVCANVAPVMCVNLFDLVRKGELAEARVIYRQLLPLLRLFEDTGELWQVTKYVLHKQGIGTGALRPPRGPISAQTQAAVDALLAQTTFS